MNTAVQAARPKARPEKMLGENTFKFTGTPTILATASLVGSKEGQGPLGRYFDEILPDDILGEKSWEKAESKIMEKTARLVADKAGLAWDEVQLLLAGDLLNQIVCCNFAARDLNVPFFGLYAACATWTEGLTLGAMIVDGGYAGPVVVATCSHNKTAERQYRFPTEFGNQRPPTAQWTVTGSGAAVLAADGKGPRITHATVGRVVDTGAKDPFDMGGAMAPAAVDTIVRHFKDTGRGPEDYDLIVTGDLGRVGIELAQELLRDEGYPLGGRFEDCGVLMFDKSQNVQAGGSGAACSATVFGSYIYPKIGTGGWQRILLVATGALFSPTTYQQGESIPCIAHAVSVEAFPEEAEGSSQQEHGSGDSETI